MVYGMGHGLISRPGRDSGNEEKREYGKCRASARSEHEVDVKQDHLLLLSGIKSQQCPIEFVDGMAVFIDVVQGACTERQGLNIFALNIYVYFI